MYFHVFPCFSHEFFAKACLKKFQRIYDPSTGPQTGRKYKKYSFPSFSTELLAKTRLCLSLQLPWSFCTSLDLLRPLPTRSTTFSNFHNFTHFPHPSNHLFQPLFPIFRIHQLQDLQIPIKRRELVLKASRISNLIALAPHWWKISAKILKLWLPTATTSEVFQIWSNPSESQWILANPSEPH